MKNLQMTGIEGHEIYDIQCVYNMQATCGYNFKLITYLVVTRQELA